MDDIEPSDFQKPLHENPAISKRTFALLCCLQAILNFDSGAIPGALDTIEKDMGLSPTDLGILGGLPYLALTVVSPFAGYLLGRISPKTVVSVGLVLNLICCIVLAASRYWWMLFPARFCIGLTQANFLIYAPVWVEEFAPGSSKTTWVACLQASIPVGVVMGYLVAGLMTGASVPWGYAMMVQCILLLPLIVLFLILPRHLIDVKNPDQLGKSLRLSGEKRNSIQDSRQVPLRASVLHLSPAIVKQKNGLFNGLYISMVFALCALYFVVAGMQYWSSDWLLKDFQFSYYSVEAFKKIVVGSFGFVAATGPIAGVLFGGCIIDVFGGYGPDPDQRRKAMRIMTLFAILGAASGIVATEYSATYIKIPNSSVTKFVVVVVLLWTVLFFGGAIVPGATGIMLTSIPAKSRSLASGIGQGAYNIFGYGMGTFLPGLIIGLVKTGENAEAPDRLVGIRVLYYWSLFGVLGIVIAYFFAGHSQTNCESDENDDENDETDNQIEMGNSPTSPKS